MTRFVLVLVALAACAPSSKPSPARARVIEDATARTITLGSVERIVSLAPSSTEIVYALGAGDLVVGVDRFSDYPRRATQVAQVGSNMEPSLERILALKPDVVLVATSANAPRVVDQLTQVGLTVYVSKAESLEAIFTDVTGIGHALGREAQAQALVAQLHARLAAVEQRIDARSVSCAVIVWPAPLVVAAGGNHVNDLLAVAGGKNVVDDSPVAFPTYSLERLVKKAPEVLLVGTHATGAPALAPLEQLTSIPAVRDHRVHLVDGDLLFRPGPRVIDGIELVAALLHPNRSDGGTR